MKPTFPVLFALTLISIPVFVFASLGDSEKSLNQDAKSLHAVHKKSQESGYTVHELSTSTNSVKEYVSPSGVVFAVTWRGMNRPDLSTLLGAYYTEYAAANAKLAKARGRHSTTVKTARVVVMRGGHMRDIHGKAFNPDMVPAGVNVEDLP